MHANLKTNFFKERLLNICIYVGFIYLHVISAFVIILQIWIQQTKPPVVLNCRLVLFLSDASFVFLSGLTSSMTCLSVLGAGMEMKR